MNHLPKPFPFKVSCTPEVIDQDSLVFMSRLLGLTDRECVSWFQSCGFLAHIGKLTLPIEPHPTLPDRFNIGDPKNFKHIGLLPIIKPMLVGMGVSLTSSPIPMWYVNGMRSTVPSDPVTILHPSVYDDAGTRDFKSYYAGALVVAFDDGVYEVVHNSCNRRAFLRWLNSVQGLVFGVGVTVHRMRAFTRYCGLYAKYLGQRAVLTCDDLECRPYHLLRSALSSYPTGATPTVCLDNFTGGWSMEEHGCIVAPCLNVIQFPSLKRGGAACPFMYPYPALLRLVSKLGVDGFYSGYYENSLGNPEFMKCVDLFTPHCTSVKSLEANRVLGKQVASKIGLNVPAYVLITKAGGILDSDPRLDCFTDRVALKYNEERFIGIFDTHRLEDKIRPLLSHGDVVVEQYIGSSTQEVNFSFMVSSLHTVPILWLTESCRMMGNDSGGKTGLSMAMHCAATTKFCPTLDDSVHKSMQRLYPVLLETFDDPHLFGWVDVSLMLGSDGLWYFTEWMFRNGVSNFACINAHLKTPYMDLWKSLRSEEFCSPVFRSEVSLSSEVVLMQFGGGSDNMVFRIPSPVPNSVVGVCHAIDGYEIRFCPIESGGYVDPRTGDVVVDASSNVRYGVFTITGGTLSDVRYMSSILESYLHKLGIPFSAFVCDHHKFLPLLED